MVSLEVESWVWYGIVITLVILRYVSRTIHLRSIKKFQLEDGVMVFVAICYTLLIIFLNIVNNLPTNLVPPDQINTIDPNSIPQRIRGSKLVIVVEQLWCATVWSCKICLLLLYSQLTIASRQAVLGKIVGVYVVIGYLTMELLFYTAWCRPFHNYWSVPAANAQCATYHDHLIVNTVFNISSDLMMICIPLPILIRAQLPLQKKLILCFIFSMGIFVIICAILSKFYSFSLPYGVDWVYWYVREVSTAVIVANMPHLWALARRVFNVRSFLSHGSTAKSGKGQSTGQGTDPRSVTGQSHASRDWYQRRNKPDNGDNFLTRSESEERIAGVPLDIHKDSQFRAEGETPGQDQDEFLNAEHLGPGVNAGLYTGWQSKSTVTSKKSSESIT